MTTNKIIEATVTGYVKGKGLLKDFHNCLRGFPQQDKIQEIYEDYERILINNITLDLQSEVDEGMSEDPAALADYINGNWSYVYAPQVMDYINVAQTYMTKHRKQEVYDYDER